MKIHNYDYFSPRCRGLTYYLSHKNNLNFQPCHCAVTIEIPTLTLLTSCCNVLPRHGILFGIDVFLWRPIYHNRPIYVNSNPPPLPFEIIQFYYKICGWKCFDDSIDYFLIWNTTLDISFWKVVQPCVNEVKVNINPINCISVRIFRKTSTITTSYWWIMDVCLFVELFQTTL